MKVVPILMILCVQTFAQPTIELFNTSTNWNILARDQVGESFTIVASSDLRTWNDLHHLTTSNAIVIREPKPARVYVRFWSLRSYPTLSKSPRKIHVNTSASPDSAVVLSEIFPTPLIFRPSQGETSYHSMCIS